MTADAEKNGLLDFLGQDRRVLAALTFLYVLFGLGCIATDYTLNDEGLVTYTTADLARYFPLEVFFVQKAKPVVTLIYTSFAGLGVQGLQVIHLLICALAIPMMAAVARALELRSPNVVALAVAASPAFILAAPAALSNADGVLGVAAVLYFLLARKNPFAAGVVLGTLPWVRHELALFAATIGLWALLSDRNFRLIAGAAVFPLIYGVAGGIFHHDPIWLVNYPPSTLFSMPGNPIWADFSGTALLRGLLGLSPLVPVALCAPAAKYTNLERWLLVYSLAWITIASILPAWHIANFGFVPRYMMVMVPIAALAAGRAVQAYQEGEARLIPAGIATAVTAAIWVQSYYQDTQATVPIVIGLATATLLGVFRLKTAAAAVLTLLLAVGPALGVRTEIPRDELAAYLPQLAQWLREHPEHTQGPIYTNVPLLAPYLDGAAKLPGLDIRFLISVELAYDMEHMMSTASGQKGKLVDMMNAGKFNGAHGVLPELFSPATVPEGSLFVFRHDGRLQLLMPEETWGPLLTDIYNEDFRVATFDRNGAP